MKNMRALCIQLPGFRKWTYHVVKVTTNLDYPDWYDLFQRTSLVDALLDRLKHRCITIKIKGPSLRTPSQKNANDSPSNSD